MLLSYLPHGSIRRAIMGIAQHYKGIFVATFAHSSVILTLIVG